MRLGFLLHVVEGRLCSGLSALPRPSLGRPGQVTSSVLASVSSLEWTLFNHSEKIEVLVGTDNVSHVDD